MRKLILTVVIVMMGFITSAQIGMTREEVGADDIVLKDRTIKFAFDNKTNLCTSFLVETSSKKVAKIIVKNLMDKISNFTNESNIASLKISEDIYSLNENFIVVHGFESKEQAASILGFLQTHKDYKISDKTYVVSTEDYKIIQMKKKMNEWILLNK